MGSLERRQREKENLRRAILDAARELFVTDGYDGVTLRRVADKIEYSPTTIYLHFKDKDEILTALVEEGFHLMADCLQKLDKDDPIERLRAGTQLYLRFASEQPHYYTIMFEMKSNCHPLHHHAQPENPADKAGQEAFGFIVRCVEEGIARGQVLPQPPPLLQAHAVWASLHGAASLLLAGRLGMLAEAEVGAFLDCVVENTLRGLQCPTKIEKVSAL